MNLKKMMFIGQKKYIITDGIMKENPLPKTKAESGTPNALSP